MYYLAFPNDPTSSKALAFGVFLFEAGQTFLLTQSAFHGFAEGFGNLIFLDEIGTIWFSVPIMSGIGESQIPLALFAAKFFFKSPSWPKSFMPIE